MSFIDSLEPFLLISSLIVAIPSFALASYLYYRIWTSKHFYDSRYLRLYTLKALNEAVIYVFNLFCLHLPIQSYLHSFFKEIACSIIIPIADFILMTTILSSFLFGIFLTLNRYLAIARWSTFRLYDEHYVQFAIMLTYPLPILFGARSLIWRSYLLKGEGKEKNNGTIFLYFTPPMGDWTVLYEYSIAFYHVLCCFVEFAINGATLYAIVNRQLFESSPVKRQAEIVDFHLFSLHETFTQGLYVTTLCSFLVILMYTVAQICIQIFPFTEYANFAIRAQLIVMDVMALSNVYFLIAFSPTLRKHIFAKQSGIAITMQTVPTSSGH